MVCGEEMCLIEENLETKPKGYDEWKMRFQDCGNVVLV